MFMPILRMYGWKRSYCQSLDIQVSVFDRQSCFLNERLLLLGKWTLSNMMYLFHDCRAASRTLNRACGWTVCRLADIFGHVDVVFQNFLFDTSIKVFLSRRLEHFIQTTTTAAAAMRQTACERENTT